MDWYGTVHIGIASGVLSLSETRNEVSRYGSSMALKTGQLTTISNDPAAVQSIKGDSSILQKKQSIKGDSSILETRRDGIASLSRETHPYSKTENIPTPKLLR